MILPMINEGARILDEGIASRPGDIDVIWVYGYGWPVWRGGPMYYADRLGLPHVRDRLAFYADRSRDESLRPSPLLQRLAAGGRGFARDQPVIPSKLNGISLSAPGAGEGRGEVGDSRAAADTHLTLPRRWRGPLPLPPEGWRGAFTPSTLGEFASWISASPLKSSPSATRCGRFSAPICRIASHQAGRRKASRQGRHRHLAAHPQPKGLGGRQLAGRVGRHRLDARATIHIPGRAAADPGAAATRLWRHDGRPGHHRFRLGGAEEALFAGASPISTSGGARDFPSPVRARIWPLYGLRLSVKTTTTSSTARRPGLPWLSTPIGSSAWCAPIRRPKSRKEFPFC